MATEGNKTDSSKSETYNKAVQRATGNAGGTAGEIATTLPKDTQQMVSDFKPESFQAEIASGDYEAAPQIYSLKEGQMIEGILEGNGPMAEFKDEDTGEVTYVKTWVIADPTGALRVSILSSAQLDRKLNGFIGQHVKIARGKDVSVNGTKRRMTEYMVWGKKLPGGKKRQWFDISNETRMAIDASSVQHKALPAGQANGAADHS